MNRLIFLLILLPSFLTAQNKHKAAGYFNLNVGMYKFKETNAMGVAGVSFGARIKDAYLAVGGAITKFPEDTRVYYPIFFELGLDPVRRKVTPYFNLRIGQGFYNQRVATVETSGGLYGGINVGFGIPVAKTAKATFTVGYVRATFQTKVSGRYGVITSSNSINDGFSAGLSFTI